MKFKEIFEVITFDKWVYNLKLYRFPVIVIFVFFLILPNLFTCNSSISPLDEAISEYNTKTGKKIYPYGKQCLEREGNKRGLKTKEEFLDLIKENEKYF